MPSYSIPDPETLKREIQNSHERCKHFGVNPDTLQNPLQQKLTSEELQARIDLNEDFLNIARTQIEDLYQFVAGAGFAVNIAIIPSCWNRYSILVYLNSPEKFVFLSRK